MKNFCPFINDYCRVDCVFRTESKSTITKCGLDAAVVNLEYIGGVIAEKIAAEEEELDNPIHE